MDAPSSLSELYQCIMHLKQCSCSHLTDTPICLSIGF